MQPFTANIIDYKFNLSHEQGYSFQIKPALLPKIFSDMVLTKGRIGFLIDMISLKLQFLQSK